MAKNLGKKFEEQIKKSVPQDVFYYRFRDGTASFYGGQAQDGIRFQQRNMCDIMLYKLPILFLLELKTTKQNSLPFSNLKEKQIDDLVSAHIHKGICSGFIVDFSEKNRCFFCYANDLKYFIATTERKSIPISWFEENGIEINNIKKRVNKIYDLQSVIEILIKNEKGEDLK